MLPSLSLNVLPFTLKITTPPLIAVPFIFVNVADIDIVSLILAVTGFNVKSISLPLALLTIIMVVAVCGA